MDKQFVAKMVILSLFPAFLILSMVAKNIVGVGFVLVFFPIMLMIVPRYKREGATC